MSSIIDECLTHNKKSMMNSKIWKFCSKESNTHLKNEENCGDLWTYGLFLKFKTFLFLNGDYGIEEIVLKIIVPIESYSQNSGDFPMVHVVGDFLQ